MEMPHIIGIVTDVAGKFCRKLSAFVIRNIGKATSVRHHPKRYGD